NPFYYTDPVLSNEYKQKFDDSLATFADSNPGVLEPNSYIYLSHSSYGPRNSYYILRSGIRNHAVAWSVQESMRLISAAPGQAEREKLIQNLALYKTNATPNDYERMRALATSSSTRQDIDEAAAHPNRKAPSPESSPDSWPSGRHHSD